MKNIQLIQYMIQSLRKFINRIYNLIFLKMTMWK